MKSKRLSLEVTKRYLNTFLIRCRHNNTQTNLSLDILLGTSF